jgi:pilus assembly protein CpaB
MNRSTRTVIVVGLAVVLAGLATFLVARLIRNLPTREVQVAEAYTVVASRPLAIGTLLTAADVARVAWPAANPVQGGYTTVEEVLNRGIIAPVAKNEPLTENNLASPEAGAGLAPTIPSGMRAISVKVNEVVGVAGFVVPGTRVDVMVILNAGGSSLARVVVSNVQVLAAGTKYDQVAAREGQALPSSVVTLMVTPEDAERVALAGNEGQILLTLRNPLDTVATDSAGIRTPQLLGGAPLPVETPAPVVARPVVRRPVAAVAPPPSPPSSIYTVETIRAAKRTEETLSTEETSK